MSAPAMELTRKQALALWGKLRQHFIDAADVMAEIIEQRAWEPLGYSTFAEAYAARMADVTLAAEVRPHVVYQLLTEGLDPLDVAGLVNGIGPNGATALDRQRKNGVPADFAVVNEHLRRKPSPPDTVHVKVGKAILAEYRRIAETLDLSVEEIAKDAIAERFASLVATPKRKAS